MIIIIIIINSGNNDINKDDNNKVFCMLMDFALVLLYCPKPCCELSFSGFSPSAVPYWN